MLAAPRVHGTFGPRAPLCVLARDHAGSSTVKHTPVPIAGTSPTEPSAGEPALIARLRAGEDGAFNEVIELYTPRLYATARRMLGHDQDAQDAVQEAMLGAFRSLHSFEGGSRLSTWLTRIVINKCLMRLRTRRRRPECSIDSLLPTFKDDGHPTRWTPRWRGDSDPGHSRAELHAIVREKIEELPEKYRTVLLLREVLQLNTEDVAEALGDTPNAIKVRLHRARQALKALLDPYMTTEEP
jgi:RNA polymerase sigma-70 factor (ECF subfamily)